MSSLASRTAIYHMPTCACQRVSCRLVEDTLLPLRTKDQLPHPLIRVRSHFALFAGSLVQTLQEPLHRFARNTKASVLMIQKCYISLEIMRQPLRHVAWAQYGVGLTEETFLHRVMIASAGPKMLTSMSAPVDSAGDDQLSNNRKPL